MTHHPVPPTGTGWWRAHGGTGPTLDDPLRGRLHRPRRYGCRAPADRDLPPDTRRRRYQE